MDEAWLSTDIAKMLSAQCVADPANGDSGRERQIIEAALKESECGIYGTSADAAGLQIPPSTLDSKIMKTKHPYEPLQILLKQSTRRCHQHEYREFHENHDNVSACLAAFSSIYIWHPTCIENHTSRAVTYESARWRCQ